MAKGRLSTTRAERWAKRVERSGLSIRAFAVREGLKPGSLSFWKWKLGHQGKVGRGGPRQAGPLRFVELTAREAPRPVPGAAGFEVVLSSGRTVRVAGGFDSGELVRLVGLLEEPRS